MSKITYKTIRKNSKKKIESILKEAKKINKEDYFYNPYNDCYQRDSVASNVKELQEWMGKAYNVELKIRAKYIDEKMVSVYFTGWLGDFTLTV